MKKLIRSKEFLFSVLAVACVGILVICFLVSRDKKSDFRPEEIVSDVLVQEPQTTYTTAASAGNRTNTAAPTASQDPLEDYPMIVDESEDKVVINFTPDSTVLQSEPPERPSAEGGTDDHTQAPTYSPEEVTQESTESSEQGNDPAPGSTNGKGAVYDPVFGWVVPGQVAQTTADSSGDPNKMVGNMGN